MLSELDTDRWTGRTATDDLLIRVVPEPDGDTDNDPGEAMSFDDLVPAPCGAGTCGAGASGTLALTFCTLAVTRFRRMRRWTHRSA